MPAANFLRCCPSQLRWANWRHCAPAQRLILNPEWVHLSFQDFRWFPISGEKADPGRQETFYGYSIFSDLEWELHLEVDVFATSGCLFGYGEPARSRCQSHGHWQPRLECCHRSLGPSRRGHGLASTAFSESLPLHILQCLKRMAWLTSPAFHECVLTSPD